MGQRARGQTSYHAGLAAEAIVEKEYLRRGQPVIARRWRGAGGEIDLIARSGDALIFIEVKKGRTHASGAARISPRQMQRIMNSAQEFLETQPLGQRTDIRFDAALVDAVGRVEVIENAFLQ